MRRRCPTERAGASRRRDARVGGAKLHELGARRVDARASARRLPPAPEGTKFVPWLCRSRARDGTKFVPELRLSRARTA
jgi:hypothetical protein